MINTAKLLANYLFQFVCESGRKSVRQGWAPSWSANAKWSVLRSYTYKKT